MAAADYVTVVQQLYVSYFGRPADTAGLANFTAALNTTGVPATIAGVNAAYASNTTVKALVDSFAASAESAALYGSGTTESFVFAIYDHVLNRVPDTAGFNFWVDAINNGTLSRGNAALQIMNGALANTSTQGQADAALVNARIQVATNFTDAITTQNATYSGDAAAASARAMLDTVIATTDVTAFQSTIVSTLTTITYPDVGSTFTLTTSTTPDVLIGTAKNDTFNGSTTAYTDTDQIIDSSTADNDTLNLTLNNANITAGDNNPNVTNVENVNVNFSTTNGTAPQLDASKLIGVKNLTVTGVDVVVGGSSIAGDKNVNVQNVDATKVATVTTGAGTKAVTVVQTTKAGVTVDASTATGNIAVTGAATINADASTGTVNVTKLNNATEDAKALTINAAKATSVTTDAGFTGTITINAAAATAVTVNNAAGGVTINAEKAGLASGTGIVVAGVDDSGATITTGSYASTAAGKVSVDGTTGTTDAATISAAGYIALTTNATQQVENLTLSGNGAAVTYTLTGTPNTTTLAGDQSVTVKGSSAQFATKTVTDSTTGGTTTVSLTGFATGDLSKVAVDKIQIAADAAGAANLTVASGANVEIAKDQTVGATTFTGKTTGATINLSTGDDTNASGDPIDISLFGLTTASAKTVNLTANTGSLTVTGNTDLGATTTTLNISGSKDVNLGTVTQGKAIAAGDLTGALTMTANGANTTTSITSGSGADVLTLNQNTAVFTVDAGAGNNNVTITNAANASSVSTGAGDDTVSIAAITSIVVVTGAGNDTVTVSGDSDAIIVGGDGTDTLVLTAASATDFSNNTNFAFTGFEKVDISALNAAGNNLQISAAQFGNNSTFQLVGNSVANSTLKVVAAAGAAATIDASHVTFATTQNATLWLQGADKADIITGSAKNDYIVASTGADTVNGGTGTDTFAAGAMIGNNIEGAGTGTSVGVVINLGSTAVTNTAILGATGGYTANSITSVDAGKTAYLFGSAASTNSAVQQSLSGIENVIGTTGNDYIVGSSGNNVITGGQGADYINVGVGTDTIVMSATGETFAGTVTSGTTVLKAAIDVVAGMSAGDKIDLSALLAGNAALASVGPTADGTTFLNGTVGNVALIQGAYDAATGIFTTNAAGADVMVQYDTNGVAAGGLEAIILVGSNSGVASISSDAAGIFTLA